MAKKWPKMGYFSKIIEKKCVQIIIISLIYPYINHLENDMSVKTMIVTVIAFYAYVALCLWVMGKLAGAI